MASKKRGVVLCADDFGMSEGVSAGILDLADRNRISATSAMVNGPDWRRSAPMLRERSGAIGVGLHFNLTLGVPLGPMPQWAPDGRLPSLGRAIGRALAGTAALDEVEVEFERQLAAFEDAYGSGPDFVDGHQHVHVLPGIRDRVLAVLARRGDRALWLRDPSQPLGALRGEGFPGKAMAVRALGFGFAKKAHKAGFATNEGFSGFSAFDRDPDVGAMFERALRRLGPKPLVMCHPGRPEAAPGALDEVVESRPRELAYLKSSAFAELLERHGLKLVPRPGG